MQNKNVRYQVENNEFKKVHIKNRTCYYFDDTIKLEYFGLDNILIDRKPQENVLIYDISYKTLIDPTVFRIRFDKTEGFIRIYYGTRYLTLLSSEKYDAIYNRIRYPVSLKSGIANILCHCFAKIKVDSYDFLPIEKILT